ncbi:PTS mannose/fructose/sorbose/N-acetylgalactosamine transporter subunit IIC [Clostridium septicum]|uniref:PTS mannose/fructose/sorbose/N-acetylgalactosamine transporter subunit IIC n=1 Tax=Clostridium septicum TaxID=1504 RepID=A0A9N7JJL4_CLOSE|nr:PTS sugar transporter subunit IIC [Clostridium septicum]AYE33678.1 PTS mannose/fructose/sorbose/N-acetylgalactosamine transporter subunit IIC [Clostridium septicum]MDU1315144.1 PTS sugar transporter subunit IIC [Clostridium septicum]QAS61835.1 PTS mannose/fructose/sorbose/N-acetylgalactosamine transporter subunit IIC [Clostridium septicum]UEC21711.1 PTS sugar transporter subunit IIC [Clostridium septicum]USS00237.1 PTS sugar transporter subunit IIC [Clostridium septicum]
MEITLLQCILIGLWTAFCLSGMLLGIYSNRCIILSFGVGIILGDIPTALAMGAVSEIAFMGFGVGAGGTVPPNPMGPGIIGTLMAITMKGQGMDPATALALSFPFAVAFQFLITATYTVVSGSSEFAKKSIQKGHFTQFRIAANSTVWVLALVGFIIGFAGAYSVDGLKAVVEMIPAWLITGLSVAGKMLPAIGFAMILSVMAKIELIPFVLLGYVCVAYLNLPVIGIAFVGTTFALLEYFRKNNKNNSNNESVEEEEVVFEDGI